MFFEIPCSLRTRLFLSFALCSTLLWSVLPIWSYQTIYRTLQNETAQIMRTSMEQDVQSLQTALRQIEDIADLICNDADVQRYFMNQFNTPSEEYVQSTRMLRNVDSLLRGLARSVRLTMIGYHPDLHEIVPHDFEDRFSLQSRIATRLRPGGQIDIAIYRAERFALENWPKVLQQGVGQQWLQTPQDRLEGTVSLIQPLSPSAFSDSAGGIKLTILLNSLLPQTGSAPGGAEYGVFLLDGSGDLIQCISGSNQNVETLLQDISSLASDSEDALYTQTGSTLYRCRLYNDWQLVRIYDFAPAWRINQFRLQFFIMLLLSLFMTFMLSYYIASSFSRRIRVLSHAVSLFAQGQLTVRVPFQRDQELHELAMGFNHMAERIQSLIQEVYLSQIQQQQQQQLEMLQSQIRPHFLYNSLSAIVRLSERGDMQQVKAIALALVNFYRISLSKGRDQIPFREELRHIQAYLKVCSIRYRDRFLCSLEIDPESEGCFVPKILLQPFVENSLEHGMMDDQLLHIQICSHVHAGALHITIADDGIGVSAELLAALSADQYAPEEGYGVRNVRQRIRLAYGPGWGVHMFRLEPHGLRVEILLPALTQCPSASQSTPANAAEEKTPHA